MTSGSFTMAASGSGTGALEPTRRVGGCGASSARRRRLARDAHAAHLAFHLVEQFVPGTRALRAVKLDLAAPALEQQQECPGRARRKRPPPAGALHASVHRGRVKRPGVAEARGWETPGGGERTHALLTDAKSPSGFRHADLRHCCAVTQTTRYRLFALREDGATTLPFGKRASSVPSFAPCRWGWSAESPRARSAVVPVHALADRACSRDLVDSPAARAENAPAASARVRGRTDR